MKLNLKTLKLSDSIRNDLISGSVYTSGSWIEVPSSTYQNIQLHHKFDHLMITSSFTGSLPVKGTFGLGDLVYKIANPVAKTIDRVFKTNVAGCGGCAQRREKLNELVPDINKL